MKQALFGSLRSPALDRLQSAVQAGQNVALTGLPETMAAFIAAKLADETGKRVLLLSGNDLRATHDADDGQQLLGTQAAFLPGGELDLTRGASSHESAWRRLETLTRVTSGSVRLLCASVDAAMQRMGSADNFRKAIIRLKVGDVYEPRQLMRDLTRMGYERVNVVEGKSQCAMRGAIVDVYPPGETHSLRIEFFDDEIDSIRAFDALSQRSQERLDSCVLSPATEVLLDDAEWEPAARRMREAIRASQPDKLQESALFSDLPPLPDMEPEEIDEKKKAKLPTQKQLNATRMAELERRAAQMMGDADILEGKLPFRRIRAWLTVLTEKTGTIMDWYQPEIVVLCEPEQLRKRAGERVQGFGEDLFGAMSRGEAVREQQTLLMSWEEMLPAFAPAAVVTVSEFLNALAGVQVTDTLSLGASSANTYASHMKDLAGDSREWLGAGVRVAVLCGGVARGQRLQQALAEQEAPARFSETVQTLPADAIQVLPGTLSHGFCWPEAGLCVISDTDVYGAGYRKAKKKQAAGERIAAFTDLKPGDYVVHEDYGVGVFQGIVQVKLGGKDGSPIIRRDYLRIQYAGTDELSIPVEQFERIQRYIGNPNAAPKLNKLGTGDWGKQKARVKEGLRQLAFNLVTLYARRSQQTGFAFSADTPWQREFEDQFPYELTPDQDLSVREITADMESKRNMDRLLCGDVGYGKTEVSLRAAFKALMDDKQVAILAPTTILVQQHFNTVMKRFRNFPVKVEMLSRFKTAKEVREVLRRLKEGDIDILVGTHRLLAKDVEFRDLGLLIVDEEQRFGVQHKEQIKNMRDQVDVLTLSATPIPRTLHMSMVGIRDMSVLQTPPEERLPVQTRVIEYNDALIRDAILRELSRGGQVYFLYNSVRRIHEMYERLRALVPEARIGIAHGQMKEHGLEDVMMDFYAGSYDVLLCTTIIESGLDVPTANTLIVFDAHMFGLSQLYQLRGRVGRSNRQAYAYFTVRTNQNLSETAQQRLTAIAEFTEFGAGFRIAMRDLEIRGAGNILGPEQSGHLETVGYDLYCKMLEEALEEARLIRDGHTGSRRRIETRVDIKVDAYLPDDYVQDSRTRMEIYKRIADLSTDEERSDVIDELIDRFGEMPPVVETLLDIAQLRMNASRLGVTQVSYRKGGFLMMKIDTNQMPPDEYFFDAMQVADKRLTPSTKLPDVLLMVDPRLNEYGMLEAAVKALTRMNARVDELCAAAAAEKAAAEAAEDA
ncbi:MAG: transcription-repair coupling factor [Clostridia bacterium]|nr:transcription-repair coupling factor [Clostridia bacterium]